MRPEKSLPYNDDFSSAEEYVDSLLEFVGQSELLRTLCGGVHILDFFTSEPDLYSRVIPQDWRDFFVQIEVGALLDLLMRDELNDEKLADAPPSLIEYIRTVRKHLLDRQPRLNQCARNRAVKPMQKLARHVAVGMTIKKVHEVGLFAAYVNDLVDDISHSSGHAVTHLVDFGSGQNYLGRALASEPYNRSIVAIESKPQNAEKAREFDVQAKLVVKEKLMRNKKAFRAGLEGPGITTPAPLPTPPLKPPTETAQLDAANGLPVPPAQGTGKVQYVEHRIADGNLTDVENLAGEAHPQKNLLVMSLHSCGNLIHHGLRSLTLNASVQAVCMVGCCYNLVTERLGPATYKLPELRPTTHSHPRLESTGEANDPHGFPMSARLCNHHQDANALATRGLRLNITARMMAVQAPQNWGEDDSAQFFTRHFYRALLQRVFLERGVVGPPSVECVGGASPAGHSSGGTPIVIGSLRKGCYDDFVRYVRGAMAKLTQDSALGAIVKEKMGGITDEEIAGYERDFAAKKKNLSVIWSLMAFSAGVVEATIVVDRWLWLMEQDQIGEAWVEPVFDYRISPRNLVLVGLKR